MVTTRNQTSTDDVPTPSPTKRTTRTSTGNGGTAKSPTQETASPPATPIGASAATSTSRRSGWSHTPSNVTLIWLAISLPLVIWDTGYVLLRPHSMPGGKLHSPIWSPYELYGRIDYVYGLKALETQNGWTAAQGSVNMLETAAYLVYLYIVYAYGEQEPIQGRGAPSKNIMGQLRGLSESRTLSGKLAAWAVLLGYSTASLTFWKTILYCLFTTPSHVNQIALTNHRAARSFLRLPQYRPQRLVDPLVLVDHPQRSVDHLPILYDVRLLGRDPTRPGNCHWQQQEDEVVISRCPHSRCLFVSWRHLISNPMY